MEQPRDPKRRFTTIVFAAAVFVAGSATVAQAAVLTVTSAADAVDAAPGDGVCATAVGLCTLRAAVQEANAMPGPDTVIVPSGAYLLTIAGTMEDEAVAGDIDVTDDLVLTGAGAGSTTLDGGGLDRVIHVAPGVSAHVSGVTVSAGSALTGGGLLNEGALVLEASVVRDSSATTEGGGIASTGSLTVTSSTVRDNRTGLNAAGIRSAGTLTVQDSIVSDNVSETLGGGLAVSGTATLTRTTVIDNRAEARGLSGLSPLGGGGIGVFQDSTLTLVESTVSDNWTAGTAAGIGSFSPVILIDSTVSDNVAERNAGGVGIGNPSLLTLVRSTVSGNVALGDGGGIGTLGGPVVLTNSTISGNAAGGSGGGLSISTSTIEANNATIAFNVSDADGNGTGDGGGFFAAMVNASNTIVTANVDPGGQAPDCRAAFNSRGYNLIESTTGCLVFGNTTGNVVGVPAGLLPLAHNGGPTQTHALEPASPAIDAGNPAAPGTGDGACEATDQRSVARLDRCDIGAFEL